MNVLIVEDDINTRKLFRMIFEHYRCNVIEAQDGQDGLEMATRHRPDVIISDALMPRMDGFQLLRALKADADLKSIPFIFCSSTYIGEKEMQLALSLGAEAFVTKPIEPEELWGKTCAIIKAWESRQRMPAHPSLNESDELYLREYSRVVAAKLEEKVLELEKALALRTKAQEQLRSLNSKLIREVAERKLAEDILKEREEELATIFENAPFIMLLLDPAFKLRKVNRLACSFSGSSLGEICGQSLGEAFCCLQSLSSGEGCGTGPECQSCVIRLTVLDTFASGESHMQCEAHLTIAAKEKEQTLTFLFSTTKVTVTQQVLVLLSLQDISEYKIIEAELYHAQKMESIGTLAGGIAHDFNNILTAIFGYGELALMEMGNDAIPRQHVENLLQAAQRAASLARDLLLFSRKQTCEKSTVDLNGIVRTVEKFLLRIIGEDITCTITLDSAAMPVFADPHQLEQVLMNLATNARDAMPNGGELTIRTERASLDETFRLAHGDDHDSIYAVLTVTDTGIGMDEVTRHRIFDPFFTTKGIGKGTGLGMAVVHGIVKQHDGHIEVNSEPGHGTSFRILLPLTGQPVNERMIGPKLAQTHRGTETILVVEDEEAVRIIARSILTSFGYEVIEAVDGEDAVQKFRENRDRIQLLLLDMIMPKKSGIEAFEEIRAVAPAIKAIFTSGYATEYMQKQTQIDKEIAYIPKPYVADALLSMVRGVLDKDLPARNSN